MDEIWIFVFRQFDMFTPVKANLRNIMLLKEQLNLLILNYI